MYQRKLGTKVFADNDKAFQRDLRIIIIALMIYQFGSYMMFGQLSNYMRSFGVNENALGTISAVGSLAGVLALLGGVIGKKIGLKWMVVFNHLISVPYPLLCALGSSTAVFTVASIFSRLPYMFNFGIVVYFHSYHCNADKIKSMMLMSSISLMSGLFAPTVGGILIEAVGMRFVLLMTTLCYAVCSLLCCFMTSERYVKTDAKEVLQLDNPLANNHIKDILLDKRNLPTVILMIILACRFLCDTSGPLDGVNMITLFYEDVGMGTMQRSYASTLLLAGMIVFLFCGSFFSKKRHSLVILFFAVLNILSNLSLFTGVVWIIVLCAFLRGSRHALMSLCQNTLNTNISRDNQITLMSCYAAMYNVMQFVSTKAGSQLYNVNSYLPFATEIGLIIVWLIVLFAYETKYQKL